jgi:universal stress protein A
MTQVRRLLVAVDFSEHSKETLKYAYDFFKGCGVEMHVVHIVPDPFPEGSYIPHRSVDEMEKTATEVAMTQLKKFISRKLLESGEDIRPMVRTGTPYAALIEYAKKNEVDLIVIGSQGLGRLETMLLGNVTDKVVRKSPVPVLVYKG